MVANVKIKEGDVLFIERPFAFITIVENPKAPKMCNGCGIVSNYTIV